MAHGTGVLATIVAPHAARLRVRPAVAAAARRRARAAANRRVRASAGASAAATAARHKTAALPTPVCRVDLVIRGRRAIDALPRDDDARATGDRSARRHPREHALPVEEVMDAGPHAVTALLSGR